MIKCPWCGSTTQPKLINTHEAEFKGHIDIIQRYECGCSCVFDRKFALYDIFIVKVEKSIDKPPKSMI